MGDRSGIEWTDATWNPITGCSKVSPGCAHCYAETLALTRMAGLPGYPGLPWTPANAAANVTLRPERLDQPLRWKRPRRIFVNSMSDLFHELVPVEFIAEVFAVMGMAERHTFQVLTKRPERMRALLSEDSFRREMWKRAGDYGSGRYAEWDVWPLRNVWLGTSVENQHWADVRIPELLATPARVRFLSCEPLLGPIDFSNVTRRSDVVQQLGKPALNGIDWVIAGGESGGPDERRMVEQAPEATTHLYPDGRFHTGKAWQPKRWALHALRSMRDQCVAADVPFLFKQWGGPTAKSAGRELDGRTWDQYPG